jgi:hypothetical protein
MVYFCHAMMMMMMMMMCSRGDEVAGRVVRIAHLEGFTTMGKL